MGLVPRGRHSAAQAMELTLGNLFYWELIGFISKRRGRAFSVWPVKLLKNTLNLKAWGIIKKSSCAHVCRVKILLAS